MSPKKNETAITSTGTTTITKNMNDANWRKSDMLVSAGASAGVVFSVTASEIASAGVVFSVTASVIASAGAEDSE